MAINNIYYTITGDCQNLGVGGYSLSIDGTSPDYSINFINPGIPDYYTVNGYSAGTYVFLTGATTGFTAYNLTGGTYIIEVSDSDVPSNTQLLSIVVSTGTCVSIDSVQETTCGLNNGSVSASTSTYYSENNLFTLFDTSNNYIAVSNSVPPFYYASFFGLSAGTYYIIADDGSGCSGTSESFVVKTSPVTTYSLYTVNNSSCSLILGKIYISGLTGTPPFTYQWSNGITGQDYITGLTAGGYSVTVTDGNGCQITNSAIIEYAQPLNILTFTSVPPSCSNNDGEITIFYSGGSPPYNVHCSNGDYAIIFDTEYTFQNLAAGSYTFTVVDAGVCSSSSSYNLTPVNSFVVQSVNLSNANCFGNNGSIVIDLFGSAGSYSYELISSAGTTNTNFNINVSGPYIVTIPNLIPDTYDITITSTTSSCFFTNTYTIGNTSTFTISTAVTGTTCGNSNGSVEVMASTGFTSDIKFTLFSNTASNGQFQFTPFSSVTFTNLQQGNYIVYAQDSNGLGCITSTSFVIPQTTTQVILFPLIVNGNEISVSVLQGQPPYTINWYSYDAGYLTQTGTTATGLTPGDYDVTVVDSTGCQVKSKKVTITSTNVSTFSTKHNLCNVTMGSSPIRIPKKISQVFFDGYLSAISANTGCDIQSAVFTSNVYVNSLLYQDSFYTANTIYDVLNITDSVWTNSIQTTLHSIYGIGEVIIDFFTNTISIQTDCTIPNNYLAGATILIDLQVDYDINCRFCNASFTNCDPNVTDEKIFGIVSSNFAVGDVVIYNNQCYQLNSNPPTGLSVHNYNNPMFIGPSACSDCLSTL